MPLKSVFKGSSCLWNVVSICYFMFSVLTVFMLFLYDQVASENCNLEFV